MLEAEDARHIREPVMTQSRSLGYTQKARLHSGSGHLARGKVENFCVEHRTIHLTRVRDVVSRSNLKKQMAGTKLRTRV